MIARALTAFSAAALLAFTAHAQTGPEADIKKSLEASLGNGAKVDSVRDAGFLGLYEVVIGGDVLYTDRKAGYLVLGDIVETKSRKNLTEERKNKLAQIKFSDLPLELAIKQVRGNGRRVFASFEDPNCGYCKKLAKEVAAMKDVTIYTFLYPILSPDSTEKSKAIWCASDRAKAWNDWMVNGVEPATGKCDASAIDKVTALGRKLNIRGTPTIFSTDGSRIPGYIPVAQIEQTIAGIGSER
jgi:thiol:disulfide interchange protein DsbC